MSTVMRVAPRHGSAEVPMRYTPLVVALVLLLGCIPGPPLKPVSPLEAAQYQEAGARFAQVRLGMTQRQVLDLLGPPTGTHGWRTGAAWIPFNPGIDVARYRYHWRARGRVTFAAGIENGFQGKVILIEVDPNEIGDE